MTLEYIVICIAIVWFLLGFIGLWALSNIPAYMFPTCNKKQQIFLLIIGGPAFWLFMAGGTIGYIVWRCFNWLSDQPKK